MVVEPNLESQVLNKSFAELDIFQENTTDVVWNLVSNFKQRPYETTMTAFSKVTDIGEILLFILHLELSTARCRIGIMFILPVSSILCLSIR